MWEPALRRKKTDIGSRAGKFLGASNIVRAGGTVTTNSEIKHRTQREYPHGRKLGFSKIVTEQSTVSADTKVKHRTQREYPHGRKLGYSNLSFAVPELDVPSLSSDDVTMTPQKRTNRSSALSHSMLEESPNPLISSQSNKSSRRCQSHGKVMNSESMNEPLKPVPPAREYPHGRKQFSSQLNLSNDDVTGGTPLPPKPQARTYPHGANQFRSSVNFAATKAPKETNKPQQVSRRYHSRSFGVESKSETVKTKPVTARDNQQFGKSNICLGVTKEKKSTTQQTTETTKKTRSQYLGFSTIESLITTTNAKLKPVKRSLGHTASQALGLSHIQFGATAKSTRPALQNSGQRSHTQRMGFSNIQPWASSKTSRSTPPTYSGQRTHAQSLGYSQIRLG